MKNIRIIPRLDIKGKNLVKGVNLEGLRVLGDPIFFSEHYYKDGADEIFYQDVVASLYERNSLLDLITNLSKKIFIPLTVGGGIKSIEDIKKTLKAGADKVSINTAATKNINFISDAASIFGSSTIVVTMEVIKSNNGKYFLFVDNGRQETGIELLQWIESVQKKGAGEIAITFVDLEGTNKGFDLNLLKLINNKIKVPLIIHGGSGSIDHIEKAIEVNDNIDAFMLASMLHYDAIGKIKQNNLEMGDGNKSYLNSLNKNFIPKSFSSIKKLKKKLKIKKNFIIRI